MKFHHIGFVVANIDEYEKHLLFEEKVNDVTDPVQNARLSFYRNYSDSFLELIQPLSEESFTHQFLQKNNGNPFHHLCYEVSSEEEMEKFAKSNQMLKFKGPLKALLFDNKKIYFFLNRNKSIIEFLINE